MQTHAPDSSPTWAHNKTRRVGMMKRQKYTRIAAVKWNFVCYFPQQNLWTDSFFLSFAGDISSGIVWLSHVQIILSHRFICCCWFCWLERQQRKIHRINTFRTHQHIPFDICNQPWKEQWNYISNSPKFHSVWVGERGLV